MTSPTFNAEKCAILIGDVTFYVTQDDDGSTPYACLTRLLEELEGENVDYTDFCDRNYSTWEDSVAAPLLRKHGFKHGRFFTAEGDSFGPLSRGVRVVAGEQSIELYYG